MASTFCFHFCPTNNCIVIVVLQKEFSTKDLLDCIWSTKLELRKEKYVELRSPASYSGVWRAHAFGVPFSNSSSEGNGNTRNKITSNPTFDPQEFGRRARNETCDEDQLKTVLEEATRRRPSARRPESLRTTGNQLKTGNEDA